MKSASGIHIFVPIIVVTAKRWIWIFVPKLSTWNLLVVIVVIIVIRVLQRRRQDLVCWGNWGITYLVCMIYEIIGELTRLLLTLTIVFTMMRMKERKDEMEKHLWPNSLNSDNVTSSTVDSILIRLYCKSKTVHYLQWNTLTKGKLINSNTLSSKNP